MTYSAHPSIYVNKTVCTSGSMVRLTFIDSRNDADQHVRAAIALTHEDAVELYKLLKRMITDDNDEETN